MKAGSVPQLRVHLGFRLNIVHISWLVFVFVEQAFQICWMCESNPEVETPFFAVAKCGDDALLRHLNMAHGMPHPVRCDGCNVIFPSQSDRYALGLDRHEPGCPALGITRTSNRLYTHSRCGKCRWECSTHLGFLQHQNRAHGGKFSK